MKSILIFNILLTLLIFNCNNGFSKEKPKADKEQVSINGQIIDEQTNEPLAGVKVKLQETGETSYTDFNGNFSFKNLEQKLYTISTNMIAYKELKVEKVKPTLDQMLVVKLDFVN